MYITVYMFIPYTQWYERKKIKFSFQEYFVENYFKKKS